MIATSQFTISVVNDGQDGAPGQTGPQGVSVIKVVTEYRLSDSNQELTGSGTGYTWSETKPEIPSGKYLWERERTDLSNNTSTYGDAHCDVVISGLVFDVDNNTNAITTKVWQSDITSSINSYDGSTGAAIRDRVTQTETDITGITSRVSSVESTTSSLGTRMSSAESSITQNADNIALMVSVDGTTSALTLTNNMLTAMTDQFVIKDPQGSATIISGGKIHANAITTNMLATNAIKSTNYVSGTNTDIPANHFSTSGSYLDLESGSLYMPSFHVDGETGDAYFSGTVNANGGIIGGWNMAQNKIYNSSDTTLFYLQNPNIKYISKSAFSGSNGSPSFNDSNSSVDFDVNVTSSSNFTYLQIDWDNTLFQENGKYKLVFELLEFNADKNIGDSSTKRLHVYTTNTSSGYSPYATPFPISLDNLQHDSVYNSDKGYNVYRNAKTATYDLINQTGSQSITKTFITIWRSSFGNVNYQYGDVDFVCRISVLKDDVLYAVIEKDTVEGQVIIGCEVTENSVTSKPFYVQSDGLLHTENLDAVGGTIGGWTINSKYLYGQGDNTLIRLQPPPRLGYQNTVSFKYPSSGTTVDYMFEWSGGGRKFLYAYCDTDNPCPFTYSISWSEDGGTENTSSSSTASTYATVSVGSTSATGEITVSVTFTVDTTNLSNYGTYSLCCVFLTEDSELTDLLPTYTHVSGASHWYSGLLSIEEVPVESTLLISDAGEPLWYVNPMGEMLASYIKTRGIVPYTSVGNYNSAKGSEFGGLKVYKVSASATNGPSTGVTDKSWDEIITIGAEQACAQIACARDNTSVNYDRSLYFRNMTSNGTSTEWINITKPNRLHNYFSARPTSANVLSDTRDNTLKFFQATSAMTTGKPPIGDGFILHMGWDTSSMWDTQVAFRNYYNQINAAHAMAIRAGDGNNSVWGDWKTLMDLLYPVGSVYITSTNTNPSDATLLGGGTWSLIDKGFKSQAITSGVITFNTTNTVSGSTNYVFYMREHSIGFRIRFTNKVALADSEVVIGTIDWSKIGLSTYPAWMSITAGSDAANGVIIAGLGDSSGQIKSFDVITRNSNTGQVPASTSTSPTITFMGELLFIYSTMLDAFCDKFYWKRTA